MKLIFILLAAGKGERFGTNNNKLLYNINNHPILFYLLSKIEKIPLIPEIIIVTSKKDIPAIKKIITQNKFKKVKATITGGIARQDSVYNGLKWIKKNRKIKNLLVAVHDGARLNLTEKLVKKLFVKAQKFKAAIPGLQMTDTVKHVESSKIIATPPRERLYHVSTPQVFHFDLLYSSYTKVIKEKISVTDDASIVEHAGGTVRIIKDDPDNFKLTYFEDLKKFIKTEYRIGQGFDIHRLVPDRPLILGNIKIPNKLGLLGHSDADVLLHAVIDALMGGMGAGDIGEHFPDTDKKYKNIDSLLLLRNTLSLVLKNEYEIENLDATIFAERPKMAPYKSKIQKKLCNELDLPLSLVNIKAKTMEGVGAIGKEEAIAAQVIVLLSKKVLA